MATPNCSDCGMSFRVTCWLLNTLLLTFQLCINWNGYLICSRVWFPCNVHFQIWLLLQMPCPHIWPFIFKDLVCHYQLVGHGLVPCVGLILPCRSFRQLPWFCIDFFHLSGKVVALHLDNSTAKAYLCNDGGMVSPFLSRLAYQVLSVTDKHSITLIPAYIPTYLNVESDNMPCDQLFLELLLLPHMAKVGFHFGVYQRWTCWLPPIQLNASIITPWKCHYLWGLWGCLPSTSLGKFLISYMFPPPALVPLVLCKFLTEHVKGQLRLLILMSPCWMEAPGLPIVDKMLADIPQHCPIIKDLIVAVLVGHVLKGLPYLHLRDRGSHPQSIRQWWGQLVCLGQRFTSNVGRNG